MTSNALKTFGKLESIGGDRPSWFLVTDWLSPKEAIKHYGPVTSLIIAPQGEFRRAPYGNPTFVPEELDPRKEGTEVACSLTTILT